MSFMHLGIYRNAEEPEEPELPEEPEEFTY